MSFTRYWKRTDKEIDQDVVDMAKKIIDYAENNYHIKLAGLDGCGSPRINTGNIMFNGDVRNGEACEGFSLNSIFYSDTDLLHCETNRRPYDIVVNAMLKMLEAQGIVKDVSYDDDEEEAQELLEKALGIKMSTDDPR